MVKQELLVIIWAETPEQAALLAERVAGAALDAAVGDGPSSVRIKGYGSTANWRLAPRCPECAQTSCACGQGYL